MAKGVAGQEGSMKSTSSKIFSGLARSYEKVLDYATLYQDRRWKVWVADRIAAGGGGLVLDVGSGTMVLEERLARWKYRFVTIDLVPEMIMTGRKKRVPNVALVMNGDAEYLPFSAQSFDSVISCYVPKYVDLRKFAGELARVTKPGGVAVMYDFAKPTGILAPFLELYIQGGLRLAGLMLGLMGKEESFTFRKLPEIIDNTSWDLRVEKTMENSGFELVSAKRLTGGAVFAYCGRRRERLRFPDVGIGSGA